MKAPFSFRRHERLKKRCQFQKVYKEGRPVKGKDFQLILLPTELPYNRIGFSVESKKIPLSNRRIRVKRLLRETYRLNKPLLKSGFDVVIIARAGAQELGFKKTGEEILYLFRKADLLRAQ